MRVYRADGSEAGSNNKYTRWLLNPEGFDPDRLDVNEFNQGDGRIIAKIPKDRDRIRIREDGSVCLVIKRETDEETGEIREETVRIGTDVSGMLRGMMFADENYHDYYDIKGRLFNDPMRTDNLSGAAAPPADESPGACPQVTHAEIEEELKKQNHIRIGDLELVRIPKVQRGKIRILDPDKQGRRVVEYIHGQWYDTVKKQMRNKKTRIGYVSDEYPDAMIPNDRYKDCFVPETGEAWSDRIGKAVAEIRQDVEERKRKEEEEKQHKAEEERYKTLFGEGNEHTADAAQMRLSKIVSEMYDRDPEAYVEEEEEEEEEDPDESHGSSSQMTHGESEEEAVMSHTPTSQFPGVSMEDERAAILVKILDAVTKAIQVQAKKHPDALINVYKARKINEILIEIRIRYQGSGYEDLLELIEEPHEVEEDGQRYLTGMTYSDVEVLLCHYGTILENIRIRSKK